jgi:hypothetical protein
MQAYAGLRRPSKRSGRCPPDFDDIITAFDYPAHYAIMRPEQSPDRAIGRVDYPDRPSPAPG